MSLTRPAPESTTFRPIVRHKLADTPTEGVEGTGAESPDPSRIGTHAPGPSQNASRP